jgi:Spy/CpxP family protein refolding chaperone
MMPIAGLFAQEPAAAPTPSVSAPAAPSTETPGTGEAGHGHMRAALASLTPAERQELKQAHQKALSDPSVQAVEGEKKTDHKAYHKAVVAAMIKADPNVEPILAKLHGKVHKKDLQSS